MASSVAKYRRLIADHFNTSYSGSILFTPAVRTIVERMVITVDHSFSKPEGCTEHGGVRSNGVPLRAFPGGCPPSPRLGFRKNPNRLLHTAIQNNVNTRQRQIHLLLRLKLEQRILDCRLHAILSIDIMSPFDFPPRNDR